MSEADRGSFLAGELLAHSALLGLLVAAAAKADPGFREEAQAAFDTLLGQIMQSDPHPSKQEAREQNKIQARASFTRLLSLVEARAVPPLTLRRRFLNWLQKG